MIGIAKAIIQPYKDLYNIALHNDMIRHDEKIKARERERVKTTTTPPPRPTRQNIKKTLDNIDTNINK